MNQIYSENPFNYDENDLGKYFLYITERGGSPFFLKVTRPRSILSPNSKRPS